MSDDQRQRHPIRDQGDNPPEDGTRSDYAGTGGPTSGVAPGGAAVDRAEDRAEDRASSGGDAPVCDPLADVEHPTADE